jgi:hypothetical protein
MNTASEATAAAPTLIASNLQKRYGSRERLFETFRLK